MLVHTAHTTSNAAANVALVSVVAFGPRDDGRAMALFLGLTLVPFAALTPAIALVTRRLVAPPSVQVRVGLILRSVVLVGLSLLVRSVLLYPLALVLLVLQKAHTVIVYAAVPAVARRGGSLVSSNARLTRMAAVGSGIGAALGLAVAALGSADWAIWAAAAVCVAAASCVPSTGSLSDRVADVAVDGWDRTSIRSAAWPATGCKFVVGALMFACGAAIADRQGSSRMVIVVSIAACSVGGAVGTLLGPQASRRFGLASALRRSATSASVMMLIAGLCKAEWMLPCALLLVGLAGSLARQHRDVGFQRSLPSGMSCVAFARWDSLNQLAWVLGAGLVTVFRIAPLDAVLASGCFGGCAAAAAVTIGRQREQRPITGRRHRPARMSTHVVEVLPST